jgi:hypothetical protein
MNRFPCELSNGWWCHWIDFERENVDRLRCMINKTYNIHSYLMGGPFWVCKVVLFSMNHLVQNMIYIPQHFNFIARIMLECALEFTSFVLRKTPTLSYLFTSCSWDIFLISKLGVGMFAVCQVSWYLEKVCIVSIWVQYRKFYKN